MGMARLVKAEPPPGSKSQHAEHEMDDAHSGVLPLHDVNLGASTVAFSDRREIREMRKSA